MPMHDWTRVDANDYHHFHGAWIYAMAGALNNGVLPDGYFALAQHKTPPYVPDVLTLGETGRPKAGDSGSTDWDRGPATATLPGVRFTARGHERTPPRQFRRRITIEHARGRRLVAVIELVSPTNKRSRTEFTDFVGKAVAVLRQGIHLLVIDPFPPAGHGRRVTHAAIWKALARGPFDPPADKPLAVTSFAALGEGEYAAVVEPVAVGDPLPDMPLFLTPDRYAKVPLEAAYQSAWASFPAALRPLVEGDAAP